MAARLSLSTARTWSRLCVRLACDESGATAIEYGLIVSLIFLAILGGLSLFATNENAMYTRISNTIASATH